MPAVRTVRSTLAAIFFIAGLSTTAFAQSAIVGVVKDTSGAVLPGVTVEAQSEALIEGTKSAVTDSSGQYRIVDLRPGTYSVTFQLAGFQSLTRDGIALRAEFTATIDVDMKVGSLEESIIVTGDAPVVDVTTAVHTQTLNREVIDAIPTGRTIQGMGQLIVGVNLNLPDTGGARAMQQTYMSTHGMTAANNTVMVDGMTVNGLQSDGAIQSYFNDAMNQEVSYQTAGIGADTSSGGVRLNMIPREGGNRFSGDFKSAYRPGAWQGSNLTERHVAAGLQVGNHTDKILDLTFSQGGPIMKNRLWFFASARSFQVDNFIANTFFDDGRQGVDDQFIRSALLRLTWQVTSKLKFSAYQDEIDKYRGHDMTALVDPETAAVQWFSPAYHTNQAKLTATLTSRILLEGGFSSNLEYYTNSYRPGVEEPRGTAAWLAGASRSESDLGGRTRAASLQSTESPARYNFQSSMSYVTGRHNVKVGWQYQRGTYYHTRDANADLTQNYRSNSTRTATNPDGTPFAIPDSVTVRNTPISRFGERLNYDLGIYAQDSWTTRRLTLNFGLRWEAINASVMPATSPAGRFVPERSFQEIKDVPNWKNWAPRMALVFDVFGNAKTAVKFSANRYNQARTTGVASVYNPLVSVTAALPWRDLNGDDIAQGARTWSADGLTYTDCVYLTAGCEINLANLSPSFGSTALNTYGNYPRTWNIETALELQHELLPRLSVTGSWFRGTFHNLTTTINRSLEVVGDPLQNPNYTLVTVYNPLTGEPIPAYSRNSSTSSLRIDNLDRYDPNRQRYYSSFNFEFRARLGAGTLFGGTAFERQLDVNCTTPDNPNGVRFCDDRQNNIPFNKQLKLAGSYPLPFGLQLSGAFQSNQGSTASRTMVPTVGNTRYPANCPAPCPAGAVILPTGFLGAPTSTSNLTLDLVPGGVNFTDRINQLDLKLAKNFKVNRVTVSPTFEIFNINNSDAIISYVSTNSLSASFLKPASIMQPRMVGVGATVKW